TVAEAEVVSRAQGTARELFESCALIVGVDEAGRGPVIGPLVVAGVAVESDVELRHMNVCDSKKLSPERREGLAAVIKKGSECVGVAIAVGRRQHRRSEV